MLKETTDPNYKDLGIDDFKELTVATISVNRVIVIEETTVVLFIINRAKKDRGFHVFVIHSAG